MELGLRPHEISTAAHDFGVAALDFGAAAPLLLSCGSNLPLNTQRHKLALRCHVNGAAAHGIGIATS
ncbi:hypothetical protein PanWU01x14_363860 [Parasponia andersonii]|uniref:Uncharacterized protein n=1 Tax=Parasponia andersonii TaxID=3476 RepID=A0A2P5A6F7_PARAD|nr:hypothetical protein PanWU01x14_363860 [Parasponia andersonii]